MQRIESKNLKNMLPGMAYGACATILVTICLILLLSIFIETGKITEDKEPLLVMVSCIVGAVVGGIFARKKNKNGYFLSSVGSAVLAVSARMIISLFSEEGSVFDSGDILIAVSILCGGIVAGIAGGGKKRRRR